jgi:hypothetical protein
LETARPWVVCGVQEPRSAFMQKARKYSNSKVGSDEIAGRMAHERAGVRPVVAEQVRIVKGGGEVPERRWDMRVWAW